MNEQFKNYVLALIATARATAGMQDSFVLRKCNQKLVGVAESYYRYLQQPSEMERTALTMQLGSLLDLLDYLEHLKGANVLLVAYAKRTVLRFRSLVPVVVPQKKRQPQPEAVPAESTPVPAKLSENKQKILTYIKRAPARAKDIVDEFSVLSSRTVKRSLSELMQAGLVKRKVEDRGVFYISE